ncbi:MAG: NUDIX domain-containing protein [Bacteroidetes bacterium]|nr:NUDIX domain-containing protein [Bacteroidota bacterium]HET6243991.1 NUDIX domain-containing protein [Bacteroidia bacterium]
MYKIFINNKCIELTDNNTDLKEGTMRIEYENHGTFEYAVQVLSNRKDILCVRIEHLDPDYLLGKLLAKYKIILAAGGLVENEQGELLIIFRHQKWDLPKGKLKKNENEALGAIREVQEECGVKNLTIVSPLSPTYHIYELKGKLILKKTFWFKMFCEKKQDLVPQLEEDITKVEWFKPENLNKVYANTYGSIAQVLNEFQNKRLD